MITRSKKNKNRILEKNYLQKKKEQQEPYVRLIHVLFLHSCFFLFWHSHRVMETNEAVGLVPGGIAEIFEGYPKYGEHPDEEYTIVRKGFLKMAIQHNRPVVPIYCFGATKMLRRLNVPFLEWLSNLWRISLCVFYGVGGLPLPFRQRLTYVMGEPILPPSTTTSTNAMLVGPELDAQIDHMHQQFCQSLQSIFERHKEAYGWGHKTLKILSR